MAKEINLAKFKHFIMQAAVALHSHYARRGPGKTTFSLHICISPSQGRLLLLMPTFMEECNKLCRLCWLPPSLLLKVFQETLVQLVLRSG